MALVGQGAAEEVVRWANEQPGWVSVALRMLTETRKPTPEQIDDLAALALQDHGYAEPSATPADTNGLSAAHLGKLGGSRRAVRLLAVAKPTNVNALDPSQRLEFARDGLTVVYGDNGSGKSGYARILKRVCGSISRGDQILPNVYTTSAQVHASATLEYTVGGTEKAVDWQDKSGVEPVLPEIAYFDVDCANVSISRENTVLWTPPVIDLLQRLAEEVIPAVQKRLLERKAQIGQNSPKASPPDELRETDLCRELAQVCSESEFNHLCQQMPFGTQEQQRLAELQHRARTNPEETVKNCDIIAKHLNTIEAALRQFIEAITDEALKVREAAEKRVNEADCAIRSLSESNFSDMPLPGVGTPEWRTLWEAARHYAEKLCHPGIAFPALDWPCPLCQQTLDTDAQQRMSRFAQFMRDAAQTDKDTAQEALENAEKPFWDAREDVLSVVPYIEAVEAEDSAVSSALRQFVSRVDCLTTFPGLTDAVSLRKDVTDLLQRTTRLQNELAQRRDTAIAVSSDSGAAALEKEIAELRAREWLSRNHGSVRKAVLARSVMTAIDATLDECSTASVSRLVARLSEKEVLNELENRFSEELSKLQVDRLPVVIAKGGTRQGKSTHKVKLRDAVCAAEPAKVLSEGERNCIALAAFFAQLGFGDSGSGIILDDPVTSLDHKWRRAIARRLAREALQRQVIIFTHDLVFLMNLLEEAENLGLKPRPMRLRRAAYSAGLCESGLPWAGMNVKDRLRVLKDKAKSNRALLEAGDQEEYEHHARITYAMLREAWERAVEEVLLNGAVERFRRSVETKRLSKVSDIEGRDIDKVETAMTKCSRLMVGHDAAPELNEPLPGPDELESDIEALEHWVREIRRRRQ